MTMSEPLRLYNTRTKSVDEFSPIRSDGVRVYSCGPTVYNTQHIGNLSMVVFTDVLRRALEYNGYVVKHTMNITDFGHLTSDADDGDDKMTLGLQREGLELTLENMKDLAERYAKEFFTDGAALGALPPTMQFPRASDYVNDQIALIKTLEEKGYAYETASSVYFDTTRFPTYGALGGQADSAQEDGARLAVNPEKHNQRDFVLWKKDEHLGWKSPWGMGFPGWHIECSVMARSTLGKQIDIHTGGIEHIGVHHNNEIAQSEAATGKVPFSNFWMHRAHILIDGRKISKSIGNTVFLRQIVDRGYSPLSYRYWLLTAHYRTSANFTWDALDGAHTALKKLHKYFVDELSVKEGTTDTVYEKRFRAFINDDLDTPKAIALVWELVKDTSVTPEDKRATFLRFDRVLGLGFSESDAALTTLLRGTAQKLSISDVPEDVQELVDAREVAREARDFGQADDLRAKILEAGYDIVDGKTGPQIQKLL